MKILFGSIFKLKFSSSPISVWQLAKLILLFDEVTDTVCVWCGRAVTIYIGTPQFALCVAESRIIVGWKLNTPGCSYRNSYHSAKQTKSNDKIKQLPGILVKKSFQINKENISIGTWILALLWKLLDYYVLTIPWDTQIFGYAGACL